MELKITQGLLKEYLCVVIHGLRILIKKRMVAIFLGNSHNILFTDANMHHKID